MNKISQIKRNEWSFNLCTKCIYTLIYIFIEPSPSKELNLLGKLSTIKSMRQRRRCGFGLWHKMTLWMESDLEWMQKKKKKKRFALCVIMAGAKSVHDIVYEERRKPSFKLVMLLVQIEERVILWISL